MTVYLYPDERKVVRWELTKPPVGPVDVEIGGGWHPAQVTGRLAELYISGVELDHQLHPNDAVVAVDTLARVRAGGEIATDEWIRMRAR